jgi:hypothetical protein
VSTLMHGENPRGDVRQPLPTGELDELGCGGTNETLDVPGIEIAGSFLVTVGDDADHP